MTQSEAWTVGRLLTWTADYLKKNGSPSPRLDAEVLLAACRKCERIALYTAFEEIVSDDVRSAFRELVKRRATGTPVAYLVGKKEFYSLSILVTPDVLIPRPETEHLVVAALDLLAAVPASVGPRIVDVGTGSGAIAVAIARHATKSAKIQARCASESIPIVVSPNGVSPHPHAPSMANSPGRPFLGHFARPH